MEKENWISPIEHGLAIMRIVIGSNPHEFKWAWPRSGIRRALLSRIGQEALDEVERTYMAGFNSDTILEWEMRSRLRREKP